MRAGASQGRGGERTRSGMLRGPRALAVRENSGDRDRQTVRLGSGVKRAHVCATEHNNQAQGLWRAAASQESTNARGSQAPQEDVREQSPQGPAHSKDSGSCSLPSWAPAPGLSPRKTRWEPGSSTSEGGRESTGRQGGRAADL